MATAGEPTVAGLLVYVSRSGIGAGPYNVAVNEPGAFAAVGLAGQFIYVHPESRTVIVKLSYYPPVPPANVEPETMAYFKAIAAGGR